MSTWHDRVITMLIIAAAVVLFLLFFWAIFMGEPREPDDPTARVWTDVEKNVNCWYVTEPGIYNSNPEVECISIMEVGGYYEETR